MHEGLSTECDSPLRDAIQVSFRPRFYAGWQTNPSVIDHNKTICDVMDYGISIIQAWHFMICKSIVCINQDCGLPTLWLQDLIGSVSISNETCFHLWY